MWLVRFRFIQPISPCKQIKDLIFIVQQLATWVQVIDASSCLWINTQVNDGRDLVIVVDSAKLR